MSFIDALLIGVVQGITECLPISSSAHLVFAEKILGIGTRGVALEVLLHLGTMCAAILFFRRRWGRIILHPFNYESARFLGALILASIPVAVTGYYFHTLISERFHEIYLIAPNLMFCGIFLIVAGRSGAGEGGIGWWRALVVGVAQSIALLPGISRSGMTVGAGLLSGMKREGAVEFAFMLSVPAILGATIFELKDISSAGPGFGGGVLAIATLASFLSGYGAIGVLMGIVRRGKLAWFGCYCLAAGIAITLW